MGGSVGVCVSVGGFVYVCRRVCACLCMHALCMDLCFVHVHEQCL